MISRKRCRNSTLAVAAENAQGVWMSCGYGNTILLSRKLTTRVSRCQAVEPVVENGYRKLVATCR
ncbi:conserved hypothetical protein [Burkholderia sp. 8Y]|uniref:STY0301 family protein n=1 Tax=Burkholderia sp. 8Y TaxID=2653133 RepID=UPI0012F40961|nr:conserved hypothetical protein [Burkholderia sp. 8Y]